MKQSVIHRLRDAERWFAVNGPQWQWVRELVAAAAQELESESGALWMQWATREGHIRIFVSGEMNQENLDALMEALRLSRDTLEPRGHA